MNGRRPARWLFLALVLSVFARLGIAAVMPVHLLASGSVTWAALDTTTEHEHCPAHASAKADSAAGSVCSGCGQCCVSAPTFAFNPDSGLPQLDPQQYSSALALPPLSYLTPGIERPPSFSPQRPSCVQRSRAHPRIA